jgi:rubrerythrin
VSVVTNLRKSIREEEIAEAHYLSRALSADPVTARLYRHIAAEERIHAREFKARLKLVSKAATER